MGACGALRQRRVPNRHTRSHVISALGLGAECDTVRSLGAPTEHMQAWALEACRLPSVICYYARPNDKHAGVLNLCQTSGALAHADGMDLVS